MVNNMLVSELDEDTFNHVMGKKSEYNDITNEIIDTFEKKLTKTKKGSNIKGVEKFVEEESNGQ